MAKSNKSAAPVQTAGAITKQEGVSTLFIKSADFQAPEGAIVKTMSPMLKPDKFPDDAVLVGIFTKMFETTPAQNDDGTPKRGTGIEIIPEGAPVGVALPAVSTLITGLEITGVGRDAKSPHLGCKVAIKKLADKIPSKKGQAAWNFVVIIYPRTSAALPAAK